MLQKLPFSSQKHSKNCKITRVNCFQ